METHASPGKEELQPFLIEEEEYERSLQLMEKCGNIETNDKGIKVEVLKLDGQQFTTKLSYEYSNKSWKSFVEENFRMMETDGINMLTLCFMDNTPLDLQERPIDCHQNYRVSLKVVEVTEHGRDDLLWYCQNSICRSGGDEVVMARSQAQDAIRCQYCEEEPALFHCVPCGDELCPRCKTFHLKSKVPSGHNIIPISERLHPTNMVRMCESHPSKPYDACCEDCKVPVCILCIQEIHNKHDIGKMQDMYEKQKAIAITELSEMKTQKRADVIQRIKDVENGVFRIFTCHEDMEKAMKKQANDFIDHISAILNEALNESKSDKMKNLNKLSEHKAELEEYKQNVEHVIEKLEDLTESSPPADLILYRKQNPDVVKQLKSPDKMVTTDPTFTAGQFDKTRNQKQFGQMTKSQLTRVKADDKIQDKQTEKKYTPYTRRLPVKADETIGEGKPQKMRNAKLVNASANTTLLPKTVLIKRSGKKLNKKKLRHVACVGDERAYISGSGSGINLIDRSMSHLDKIYTSGEPSGLAVMKDGSLIYSVCNDRAIYRAFPNKQTTKLVNTMGQPIGLCHTRSGEILVCVYDCSTDTLIGVATDTVTMVRYSSSGEKIQEFPIFRQQQHCAMLEEELEEEWPICENVNGDLCIHHRSTPHIDSSYRRYTPRIDKVVVYNKSGNTRFDYNGRGGTQKFDCFKVHGLATDSLGHILISDGYNHVVHLISQNGDFIAYILTQNDGISCPLGISVDQSDNLWLVESGSVNVYQYLS